MSNSIEITLQPVYLKNDYLYIPARLKSFFPQGKPFTATPITIETAASSFTAELQFNSKGYIWINKLRKFFAANPELQPGDRVEITEVERGKRYNLVPVDR